MQRKRVLGFFFGRKVKAPEQPSPETSTPKQESLLFKKEFMGNMNANKFQFVSGSTDTLKKERLYFYGKETCFLGSCTDSLNA